jgi:hypothetical protein
MTVMAGFGAHRDQGAEQENQREGRLQGAGSQAQAEEADTQEQELRYQVCSHQRIIQIIHSNSYRCQK